MQLKLFVMHLQIEVMIVSSTFFSQVVFTAAVAVVADEEQTDIQTSKMKILNTN
jgi:hypothetical protein